MLYIPWEKCIPSRNTPTVYQALILGFMRPGISAWYTVGVFLLGMHLSHGMYSMFQSLGVQSETLRRRVRPAAALAGGLLFLGFASIPAGVLLGLIRLPTGGGLP